VDRRMSPDPSFLWRGGTRFRLETKGKTLGPKGEGKNRKVVGKIEALTRRKTNKGEETIKGEVHSKKRSNINPEGLQQKG